jgi:cytochrome bd-type quinol oxidase subunit 2
VERAIAFAGALILVSLYALVRGGAPERSAAAMYLVAYILSAWATQLTSEQYGSVQWLVLGVDCGLLAALVSLALKANRYWAIWAASFQLIAVIAHLAMMLFPDIAAPAYATALLIWSYAVLPMLAVATYRHSQRLACHGTDPAWSH